VRKHLPYSLQKNISTLTTLIPQTKSLGPRDEGLAQFREHNGRGCIAGQSLGRASPQLPLPQHYDGLREACNEELIPPYSLVLGCGMLQHHPGRYRCFAGMIITVVVSPYRKAPRSYPVPRD